MAKVLSLFTCAVLCLSLGAITSQQFFSQSTRRDPTPDEREQVVHAGGCTAYFVENSADKTYLGSARHCFKMSASLWCNGKGTFVDNDGNKAVCQRVVAADITHDIVFFEADFGYVPKHTLRLSSREPAVKTPLKMIGYPCDKMRNCDVTVTENCWVLKAGVPSPHEANKADRSALHNCSTYGGNSGGPMLSEGTNIVVGLPFTYVPKDYVPRSPTDEKTAAHLAMMSDFVSVHRAELEAAGITIAD